MGTHGTIEFISGARGHKTRWPLFIAIGILVVFLLGYSASHFLLGAGGSSATTEGRVEIETGAGDLSAEEAVRAMEARVPKRGFTDSGTARKALSFLMQSEANAAVESNTFDLGKEAFEADGISENLPESKLFEEVQMIIKAAGEAFNSEDLDAFLTFLDGEDSSFFRYQRAKARLAFRQFDKISGTYSDAKIRVLDGGKLVVDLHCKLDAAFARSGRPIVLFDGSQSFTLRKGADSAWKICAIE